MKGLFNKALLMVLVTSISMSVAMEPTPYAQDFIKNVWAISVKESKNVIKFLIRPVVALPVVLMAQYLRENRNLDLVKMNHDEQIKDLHRRSKLLEKAQKLKKHKKINHL